MSTFRLIARALADALASGGFPSPYAVGTTRRR